MLRSYSVLNRQSWKWYCNGKQAVVRVFEYGIKEMHFTTFILFCMYSSLNVWCTKYNLFIFLYYFT